MFHLLLLPPCSLDVNRSRDPLFHVRWIVRVQKVFPWHSCNSQYGYDWKTTWERPNILAIIESVFQVSGFHNHFLSPYLGFEELLGSWKHSFSLCLFQGLKGTFWFLDNNKKKLVRFGRATENVSGSALGKMDNAVFSVLKNKADKPVPTPSLWDSLARSLSEAWATPAGHSSFPSSSSSSSSPSISSIRSSSNRSSSATSCPSSYTSSSLAFFRSSLPASTRGASGGRSEAEHLTACSPSSSSSSVWCVESGLLTRGVAEIQETGQKVSSRQNNWFKLVYPSHDPYSFSRDGRKRWRKLFDPIRTTVY